MYYLNVLWSCPIEQKVIISITFYLALGGANSPAFTFWGLFGIYPLELYHPADVGHHLLEGGGLRLSPIASVQTWPTPIHQARTARRWLSVGWRCIYGLIAPLKKMPRAGALNIEIVRAGTVDRPQDLRQVDCVRFQQQMIRVVHQAIAVNDGVVALGCGFAGDRILLSVARI